MVTIVSNISSRQYAYHVARRIKVMEELYSEYITEKFEKLKFDSDDIRFDPEILAKLALNILKPSLEGLIVFINKAYLSRVKIHYQSVYFPNLLTLCEEFFYTKNSNPGKRLSNVEIERLNMAVYDAVYADIYKRTIEKSEKNSENR